jgi:hypothetical protein
MRTTRANIYKKKIKIHQLAYKIVTSKDELEKKRLRTQLKRQLTNLKKINTIKMMAQPIKVKTII